MWAKQYIQFHKNSPRLFFFSCFFFFLSPHFLNRASIGMREVEVPDLGQKLKSLSSDPACYCPTWPKVFLWLFWCPWFAHFIFSLVCKPVIFKVLFMLSLLTPLYTHIYLKRDSPLKFLLLLPCSQLTQLVCQAMIVFTIKGCNKQSSVMWGIIFNILK